MGSTANLNGCNSKVYKQKYDPSDVYGPNLKLLPTNDQVKELQTILRDKNTSRNDFKFYADRLIRLVIEESLNQLPFTESIVTTPTGKVYSGLKYQRGNCGVSIVRSGEVMEQGLRDCCRSIRIGKILIESDADTHEAKVVYAKFPQDIAERKVLLMYPIMSTGNTAKTAVAVLKEHNVTEDNIILSNIFSTPASVKSLLSTFPNTLKQWYRDSMKSVRNKFYFDLSTSFKLPCATWVIENTKGNKYHVKLPSISNHELTILTSELHSVAPNHFGQKYFGTD